MLYTDYRSKVQKFIRFLRGIVKYRVLIISVLTAIIALWATFLGVKGTITVESECQDTIYYGEKLDFEISALFADVYYEYAEDGSGNWSESFPRDIGDYKVRGVSKGGFGKRYSDEYEFTIVPASLTVSFSGSTYEYGGAPALTGSLAYNDERIECENFTYGGYISNTCTVSFDVSGVRVKAGSKDRTSCYIITAGEETVKTFTVLPRAITLSTDSKSKEYDGTPLSCEEYDITNGSLAEGDNITVEYKSITDVGAIQNNLVYTIKKGSEDVTAFYTVTPEYGTLTVTKRSVLLKTQGGTFVYDGTVKSSSEVTVDGDTALVSGHNIEVTEFTSITDVGKVQNKVTVKIKDGSYDVSNNYSIDYGEATYLEVTPRDITVVSAGAERVYDGTALFNTDITCGNLVNGHLAELGEYAKITDAGEIENKITVVIKDVGRNVTSNYNVQYQYGTLKVSKRPIKVYSESAEKIYDGLPLVAKTSVIEANGYYSLVSGHEIKSVFKNEIINKGQTVAEFTATIVNKNGNGDVTKNYDISYGEFGTLIVLERPIMLESVDKTEVYDGEALNSTEVKPVVQGGYLALVNGHTYKATFTCSVTDVKDSPVSATFTAVILDANCKDVTDNYNVGYTYGTLSVTKRPVMLRSADKTKVYDGEALNSTEVEVVANGGYLALVSGHTFNATFNCTVTNVKDSPVSAIFAAVILDASGKDVTDNYSVEYWYGTLSVTKRPVLFKSADKTKVYDGEELKPNASDVSLSVEGDYLAPVSGHTFTPTFTCSVTEVKDSPVWAEFTVSIFDASGRDVTDNYEVEYNYGTLTVTKRPIKFTSESGEKVYDGKPLTVNTVTCEQQGVDRGLVVGQRGICDDFAAPVDFGEYDNTFSAVIRDASGRDVTDNYEVEYIYGTLTITKRPIGITSVSGEKVYDGKPFENGYVIDTDGKDEGVAEGQRIAVEYTIYNGQTDVGEYVNEFEFVIYDPYGAEVTKNYDYDGRITFGKFVIKPRTVVLEVESGEKVYDGKPYGIPEIIAGADGLPFADGQYAVAVCEDMINAGEYVNRVNKDTVLIFDVFGTDRTANYNITVKDNTFVITKRNITVTAVSEEKVYDGKPFELTESYTIARGENIGLADGHYESVITEGNTVKVGSVAHTVVSVEIYNEYGVGVTENYNVIKVDGTLTVTVRDITLTARSNTWQYDGLVHELHEADVGGRGLAEGDGITVTTDGSIKDVGWVESKVIGFVVLNSLGEDVTFCYNVTEYVSGTLTVVERIITVRADSAEKVYDGTPLTEAGFKVGGAGLVEGHTATATVVGSQTDAGFSYNVPSNAVILDENGNDVTKNYRVSEYVNGLLTVTKRPVKIISSSKEKVYDGTPLIEESASCATEITAENFGLVEGHTAEYSGFFNEAVNVGLYYNSFVVSIYADGRDVTHNYDVIKEEGALTVTVRPITVKGFEVEKIYDGKPYVLEGLTVTEDSLALVEGHVFVVDIDGIVNAGEYVNAVNASNVKIVCGTEDMTANYSVEFEDNKITVAKRLLTITAADGEKVYDGTPLEITENKFTLSTGENVGLLDGHRVFATTEGSITLVGSAEHTVGTVYVFDKDGADVTDNYEIERVSGALTVTPRPITVKAKDGEWTFDGLVHELHEAEVVVVEGNEIATNLAVGDYFAEVVTDGSIINIGTVESNLVSYDILNASGEKVDFCYEITELAGTLKINPRPIKIVTDTAEKVYDGTPLTAGYQVLVCDLMEGHELVVEVTGSQTDAGASENTATAKVVADGNEILGLYEFDFTFGTLTVTQRPIKVVSGSGQLVYNAEEQSLEIAELSSEQGENAGLIDGHKVEYNTFAKVVDVGTYNNTFKVTVKDAEDNDVTANYKPIYEYGRIEIVKFAFTVYTGSASKPYDGEELTCNEWNSEEWEASGFEEKGFSLEVEITGSIVRVGVAPNTAKATVTKDGTDCGKNFEITVVEGTLEILLVPLVFTSLGAERVYDGTPLTFKMAEITAGCLKEGHYAEYLFTGSITDAGEADNVFTAVIYDGEGNDVTAEYEIESYVYGKLVINKYAITIQAKSAAKRYDGTPLNAPLEIETCYELEQFISAAAENGLNFEWAVVEATGSITEIGNTESAIPVGGFVITLDGVDVTHNFDITYLTGTLTVSENVVNVYIFEIVRSYTGEMITFGENDWYIDEEQLVGLENYNIDIKLKLNGGGVVDAQHVSVARLQEESEIRITYKDTGEEVPEGNIKIMFEGKGLTINKREIEVTADSKQKEYDGEPLFVDTCKVTKNFLLEGHRIVDVIIEGQVTTPEEGVQSAKIVSLRIVDADGNDVTNNYDWSGKDGTLRVTEKKD